ncbi:MAG TPA: alpha-amylase family glycosyl hydrolase [Solirubrobacteraceae bacterium]|nr:alpha-amylase family glycosyl hydrolase [Solirubrobacteraceae bacterium]
MAPSELRATYRLQLTAGFGFDAARELIPYLRDLGISHLYLSPSFQARPGSTHGYDVIDPARLSENLGGLPRFRALAAAAAGAGLGIVLDVVPNHMCVDDHNRFWADPVLRPKFFDIDPATGLHRRFFDIDELAGVRVEDPEVFEAVSGLVLRLVRDGLVDGLRVDHPDGLADPAEYLGRLRAGGAGRVWVEKILQPFEKLREWPVSGTVGYEFLNDVCALYVDPAGERDLTALWERVSGDRRSFAEVAVEAKLEQATGTFRPELERLGRLFSHSDHNRPLAAALSSLPVYRTYIDPGSGLVADADRAAIEASGMDETIATALLHGPPEFVTRFQQTTPAIMAKGVEDTAFYRYCRLLALNDVGGDPGRFGIDVAVFHAANAERLPENLLTTMTHDAKRSADVRARIGALSSVPGDLAHYFDRFCARSERHRSAGAPDDVERYLIFQTLLGAWPIELERLTAYVEKALREAKRTTNWVAPNIDHEQAVTRFCRALYADEQLLSELVPFLTRVAELGERAALGQLALKLTAPGVPDIYQGDEIEYRALVDPDNRRPVDWGLRQSLLRRLLGGGGPGRDTRKLYVALRLLGLRARRPAPFSGGYEPLQAGPAGCAFVRGGAVLTLAMLPRAGADEPVLHDAPNGRWREVLTGERRSFDAGQPLSGLVGEHGFAVYERLG